MYFNFLKLQRKLRAIGSAAFNLLQIISALLTIITPSLGAVLIAWFFHLKYLLLPLSTFMLGVFVTCALLIFFIGKSSPPPQWMLHGYRQVRWESLYAIHENDPKHHTFTITVEIEAIQRNVNTFKDSYQWTGSGKEEVPRILNNGQFLTGNVVKKGGWNYYLVNLKNNLSIGERTELKIMQELYDLEGKFQPFLARVVSQPVDDLILRVVLPTNNLPSHVNFAEYNTAGPICNKPGKINNQNGEICWEIPSPVFSHRYEVSWGY